MKCIYKAILIRILVTIFSRGNISLDSPTALFVHTCKKYDLYNTLRESVLSGVYMPIQKWKKIVYNIVTERDKRNIRIQCSMYKVLSYFDTNGEINAVNSWWK